MNVSSANCIGRYWDREDKDSCASGDQPNDITKDYYPKLSTGQFSYSIPIQPVINSSLRYCKDSGSLLSSGAKLSTKMEPMEDSVSNASTLSDTGCIDQADKVFTDEDDTIWTTVLESCGDTLAFESSTLRLENDVHVPPGDDFDLCLASW